LASSFVLGTLVVLALLFATACNSHQQPLDHKQPPIEWETIGSWSGRGNKQTDSFMSDTGALRIQWEAKSSDHAETPGKFRLTIHSSISGRPLSQAVVDQKGAGKGTTFFSEDPRVFFAVVESEELDWSFTIEDRVR
jgi:hypothetical protein